MKMVEGVMITFLLLSVASINEGKKGPECDLCKDVVANFKKVGIGNVCQTRHVIDLHWFFFHNIVLLKHQKPLRITSNNRNNKDDREQQRWCENYLDKHRTTHKIHNNKAYYKTAI